MDTSVLISLGMVDLLEMASENVEIFVPSVVVEELEEIGGYPDPEGKAAKDALGLVFKGKIHVEEIKAAKEVRETLSAHVDEGEASCFVYCKEKGIKNLVMDDIGAASELEGEALSEGISQKISVAVIVELLRGGEISPEKARLAIRGLMEERDWKGGVLEVLAEDYLSEEE